MTQLISGEKVEQGWNASQKWTSFLKGWREERAEGLDGGRGELWRGVSGSKGGVKGEVMEAEKLFLRLGPHVRHAAMPSKSQGYGDSSNFTVLSHGPHKLSKCPGMPALRHVNHVSQRAHPAQ